ncbi:helix-turn-helix domain-containing protein [Paucisalibacillus globulus]|uniref:helix-turn-helix domain-containing protein n=1 Tax=Paucisalibacillus globulus TaxID=351095 RepID=UPI000BB6AA1F|nr:XRE family transcriptional regulator [Paucisalibacillus globulus]
MNSFADNLKRLREQRKAKDGSKLTLEKLAEELNDQFGDKGAKFSKGMLSKYENGKDASSINASFLAAYFGVGVNELIGFSDVVAEEPTTYKVNGEIPIIGTIAAGTPILAEQNILGYAPAPPLMKLQDRNVFYLKIKGESMNREFENGSFVLVDRDLNVENGEIAAVLVNGHEATVKKIHCKDNLVTLIPMSTDETFYPEVINLESTEFTIIGKVIGAFKQY